MTYHIRTKGRTELTFLGIWPSSTTAIQFEVGTSLVCSNRSQIKWSQVIPGISINCTVADQADLQEESKGSMHIS